PVAVLLPTEPQERGGVEDGAVDTSLVEDLEPAGGVDRPLGVLPDPALLSLAQGVGPHAQGAAVPAVPSASEEAAAHLALVWGRQVLRDLGLVLEDVPAGVEDAGTGAHVPAPFLGERCVDHINPIRIVPPAARRHNS